MMLICSLCLPIKSFTSAYFFFNYYVSSCNFYRSFFIFVACWVSYSMILMQLAILVEKLSMSLLFILHFLWWFYSLSKCSVRLLNSILINMQLQWFCFWGALVQDQLEFWEHYNTGFILHLPHSYLSLELFQPLFAPF